MKIEHDGYEDGSMVRLYEYHELDRSSHSSILSDALGKRDDILMACLSDFPSQIGIESFKRAIIT